MPTINTQLTGQLVTSNTNSPGQLSAPQAMTFGLTFTETAPDQWSVAVTSGLTPETFTVNLPVLGSDTITATPAFVSGTYTANNAQLTINLQFQLTDKKGIHFNPNPVPFSLSDFGNITTANAGTDAAGALLLSDGTITLVGSATVQGTKLGFHKSVGIGIQITGTIAAPLPPVPAPNP